MVRTVHHDRVTRFMISNCASFDLTHYATLLRDTSDQIFLHCFLEILDADLFMPIADSEDRSFIDDTGKVSSDQAGNAYSPLASV